MSQHSENPQSRREFLRTAFRGGALAALAAVGVALGRRAWLNRQDHECVNQGVCRGCAALDGCVLPQALSMRQATSQDQTTHPMQAGSREQRPG